MNIKDTGGLAFPLHEDLTRTDDMPQKGMTLRDYFAAKAMQGFMAGRQGVMPVEEIIGLWVPDSYKIADAMIAERNKP